MLDGTGRDSARCCMVVCHLFLGVARTADGRPVSADQGRRDDPSLGVQYVATRAS